ncbi:MAG: aminotransferase class I/II-fold pyridoxal phosphate-dependent enzyme [Acidimicrobiales bacterium]|nr:aminotransferase class I/II-fold pyridoxal phosphate-dependent enzyme [Acidimicrobiales bacterium]
MRDDVGFSPPAYPYDRLDEARRQAACHAGGVVDLSIGTPNDPPPAAVLAALVGGEAGGGGPLSGSADGDGAARGYPPSIGTLELRQAIQSWTKDRLGAFVAIDGLAACVGTKELVATTPQFMKLRRPWRDTVLYPAVSYPTYEMGARLAGLRAVPVAMDGQWRIDLSSVSDDDAERALMLWVNTPGNPAGRLDDLAAVAAWGRERDVAVFSDECYAEFTWQGPPRTILGHGGGTDGVGGVVAVHSLSKRSNMAGLRLGWYAGDPELVNYLREVRKHAGLMVPGPVQRAGVAALSDQNHVEEQRNRYLERLERARAILAATGVECDLPAGGFYLWAPVPGGDEWAWTNWMAERGGALVSPGSFYGPAGIGWVRLAMVVTLEQLDLLAERLGV